MWIYDKDLDNIYNTFKKPHFNSFADGDVLSLYIQVYLLLGVDDIIG